MRYGVWGACAWVLVSCSQNKEQASETSEAEQKAATFCTQIYEAPKRHIEAQCGEQVKQNKPYEELVELSSQPVKACIAMITPGLKASRLTIHDDKVAACAAHLEKAPWKTTLRTRDLSEFKECVGLASGEQKEGEACRLSLECGDDLWCGGATFDTDGKCRKRGTANTECGAPSAWLLDESSKSCAAGTHCNFGSFVGPYARGFARRVPVPMSEGAIPEDDTSPEGARQKALRDATELGMIGLLNKGVGDDPNEVTSPWGRDDPDFGGGLGLSGIGLGAPGPRPVDKDGKSIRPSSIRLGKTTVSGQLPPEVVQRIVRQNRGRFRLCYENSLRKNPNLQGRVEVRFVIARDGTVTNVSNAGSDLPDPGVVSCVIRAFYGLSFPQPEGGVVTVVYPIMFAPGDAPPGDPKASADLQAPGPESATGPDTSSAPIAPPPPRPADYAPLQCQVNLKEGAACRESHHCDDNLVCRNDQCAPPGKTNDPCTADLQCAPSHYCAPQGKTGKGQCIPLKSASAACTHSNECEGVCEKKSCRPLCP